MNRLFQAVLASTVLISAVAQAGVARYVVTDVVCNSGAPTEMLAKTYLPGQLIEIDDTDVPPPTESVIPRDGLIQVLRADSDKAVFNVVTEPTACSADGDQVVTIVKRLLPYKMATIKTHHRKHRKHSKKKLVAMRSSNRTN